jgi:hypothetical protein
VRKLVARPRAPVRMSAWLTLVLLNLTTRGVGVGCVFAMQQAVLERLRLVWRLALQCQQQTTHVLIDGMSRID